MSPSSTTQQLWHRLSATAGDRVGGLRGVRVDDLALAAQRRDQVVAAAVLDPPPRPGVRAYADNTVDGRGLRLAGLTHSQTMPTSQAAPGPPRQLDSERQGQQKRAQQFGASPLSSERAPFGVADRLRASDAGCHDQRPSERAAGCCSFLSPAPGDESPMLAPREAAPHGGSAFERRKGVNFRDSSSFGGESGCWLASGAVT